MRQPARFTRIMEDEHGFHHSTLRMTRDDVITDFCGWTACVGICGLPKLVLRVDRSNHPQLRVASAMMGFEHLFGYGLTPNWHGPIVETAPEDRDYLRNLVWF